MRNAISRSRSIRVWARNSVSSKTVGSGQNVTIVPVRFESAFRTMRPVGFPPFSNAISHLPPSRWISSSSRVESAFTTDTPTPCRPPEIL